MICSVCVRRTADSGPDAPKATCRPCRVAIVRLSWYVPGELNRVQADAEVTLRRVEAARDHLAVVGQRGRPPEKGTPVCGQ